MAPLTAYRRWFNPQTQLRANSWMLMSGSVGMVASTFPFMMAVGAIYGARKLRALSTLAAVAVGMTLLNYLIFGLALRMPLL